MSNSASAPQIVADRWTQAGARLYAPSPLRELFASLDQLLTCGGDARLALDPATGRNAYGCSPSPTAAIPSFASCTASTISQRGYDAADSARTALMASAILHGLIACFEGRVEAMRDELRALLGLGGTGTEVVFSASGTDAQLQALALSRVMLGDELVSVVVGADQSGSGTASTAQGLHFTDRGPNDWPVAKGAAVEDLGPVRSIAVRLRSADGRLRTPAEIDAEVLETVETLVARGARVMLQVMDCSKLGLQAPSDGCADEIAARWPERAQIVVDACQMRLGRRRIARSLARGDLVLITGSKFYTGPPFSGALLIPPRLAATIDGVCALASGLAAYTTRSDWPSRWRALREQFAVTPNFGQWLRWEAALEEIRAYDAVPLPFRRAALRLLGDGITRLVQASPALRLLPPQPRSAEADEFGLPTIFAFTCAPHGQPLSLSQCRAICEVLQNSGTPGLIGQPVGWGGCADDEIAALRLCISARHVIDAWAAHPGDAAIAIAQILDDAAAVIGRIEALLMQPDFSAQAKDLHAV